MKNGKLVKLEESLMINLSKHDSATKLVLQPDYTCFMLYDYTDMSELIQVPQS